MKKVIYIILPLLAVAFLFVGCEPQNPATTGEQKVVTPEAKKETAPAKKEAASVKKAPAKTTGKK